MSVMGIKTFSSDNKDEFDEMVNKYLSEKENLILHDHTKFEITTQCKEHYNGHHFIPVLKTFYSVIFYGELA